MTTTNRAVEVYRYHLTPGSLFSCGEQAMISAVLGTCVAVCLHDRRLRIGGMNQFMYPKSGLFGAVSNDYGDVAIPALISKLQRMGSRLEDLEAQIFGGGEVPGHSAWGSTGGRNVKTARKMLKKSGITIVSEDVGGFKGRRLIFHTGTNEALVMKTHRIRRGDYHPYRQRLGA
ncbi:MAG: chemotaxis protein CheD [Deltaproteobacteria bacterium]|jgi:chemotaxis protein CheD|nr:chemotaxis protein CheD [Deltaproteobacteria bacterium]